MQVRDSALIQKNKPTIRGSDPGWLHTPSAIVHLKNALEFNNVKILINSLNKWSSVVILLWSYTIKVLLCSLVYRPVDAPSEGTTPVPESLWRRYSEFELLRNYLLVTYPFLVVPPLPEKRVSEVSCLNACRQFWLIRADCVYCCCRLNLCGTNCLQTTWIRTLLNGEEWG